MSIKVTIAADCVKEINKEAILLHRWAELKQSIDLFYRDEMVNEVLAYLCDDIVMTAIAPPAIQQ